MDTLDSIREEMRQDLRDIRTCMPQPIRQEVHTTFNAGGIGVMVGILGLVLGLVGMYVIDFRADMRFEIMAAKHEAALKELASVRSEAEYARTQAGVSRTLAETIAQRVAIIEGHNP